MNRKKCILDFDKELEFAKELKNFDQQRPTPRPKRNRGTEMIQWKMKLAQFEKDNAIRSKYKPQQYTVYISADSHTCKAPFEQLKPIALRDMKVPKVHEGKYLVCQTIVKPMAIVSANVLVQDLNGDVEQASFYNFCCDFTNSNWLKVDTILIIKEPYLCYASLGKIPSLRVDSPSDIIFVDPTDLEFLEKIGAQKWHVFATKRVEEIRKLGNEHFKRADYDEALQFYNRAIRYDPDLAVLYLNKASACLRLSYFQTAYESAKTGMEKGGDREKALHRLALAAYGLKDWNVAVEHFGSLLKEFPKNPDAKKELKKAKDRLNESQTGKYDFKQMYLDSTKGQKEFDVADFVGPIEIAQIPGKGRGIVASKNIQKGALLLVSKAFACGFKKDVSIDLLTVNLIVNKVEESFSKLQITRTIDNLRKTPKKAQEIYALYSGNKSSQKKIIPKGIIDTALIEKISVRNRFGTNEHYGLFILPSYFNHSCIENSYRMFYGDVVTFRATTNIKQGDEITFSYVNSLEMIYSERKAELLKGWEFECKCRLCLMDKLDENCEMRGRLLEKLKEFANADNFNPRQVIVKGKPILEQLRELSANRKELKTDLSKALIVLANNYFSLRDFEASIECNKEAKELIVAEFEKSSNLEVILVNIANGYSKMNKMVQAQKYAREAFKASRFADKQQFKEVYPHIKHLL